MLRYALHQHKASSMNWKRMIQPGSESSELISMSLGRCFGTNSQKKKSGNRKSRFLEFLGTEDPTNKSTKKAKNTKKSAKTGSKTPTGSRFLRLAGIGSKDKPLTNRRKETPDSTEQTSNKGATERTKKAYSKDQFNSTSSFLAKSLESIKLPSVPARERELKKRPDSSHRKGGNNNAKGKYRSPKRTKNIADFIAEDNPSSSSFWTEKTQRKRKPRVKQVRREPMPPREVEIPPEVSVSELASRMAVKVQELLKLFRDMGEKGLKDTSVLTEDMAELAVLESNMIPVLLGPDFSDLEPTVPPEDVSMFARRPPVVSVMGHVDHGKTTLLDYLRKSTVAAGEHGGITQGISAFSVDMGKDIVAEEFRNIVFIDTPGHAAFSAMREKGSEATDIIVLVIGSDDGVRPQTQEVIKLARDHNVPMVIAVTKCDKLVESEDEAANRIASELMDYGIITENLGGDVQLVCISSVSGKGIDDLKQAIALQSEIMDLRADDKARGEAIVIESGVTKGAGAHANVLVKWGTLKTGDYVVAGREYGRVRALTDHAGKRVKTAGPSMPVQVTGLKGVPVSGEYLLPVKNEAEAREVIRQREKILEWESMVSVESRATPGGKKRVRKRNRSLRQKKIMLEEARKARLEEELRISKLKPGDEGYIPNAVPAIFKTNTGGVIDAIDNLIDGLPTDEVKLQKIDAAVGPVTNSDLDLAETTGATIFCFNTNHPASIDRDARNRGIQIRKHQVIYSLLDDICEMLSTQLAPTVEERIVGAAEVLQLIPINSGRRTVDIAGCRVTRGTIKMDAKYRVLRNGKTVCDLGEPKSLRHFKDKVNEVNAGQDCGVQFRSSDGFRPGDILQAYEILEATRDLTPK